MSSATHVGIIMDGNRRFSKRLMKAPWKGHEWGARKLTEVLRWCREHGIEELSVFALSIQNFSRPKKEFNYLMRLFQKELELIKINTDVFVQEELRIRFIGRTHMLPEKLQELMSEVEKQTQDNTTYTLNIAVAYGGQEEIVDAAKKIAQKLAAGRIQEEDINENLFEEHLQLQSKPDLIIRTGGERRTSNFLAWQSTYTEWFFAEEFWPEFSKERFLEVLNEYDQRERRFGK